MFTLWTQDNIILLSPHIYLSFYTETLTLWIQGNISLHIYLYISSKLLTLWIQSNISLHIYLYFYTKSLAYTKNL